MSHGNAFPVLTQEECRQILHHVRRIGPVRFPWELAVLFVAVVALAFSLALLTLHSWIPFASSVALLATSFLLFQLLLHECAHDALFRSRSLNTISGWLIGLLAITPFFSFRRGHAVHHSCLGTDDDPTAAPRDSRRHNLLIDILVRLRVVPVLYLGGVYGPYLLFDFRHRSRQRRRHLIVYGINLVSILAVHSTLAWTFGWERYVSLLLAAFWLSGILYEYFFTQNQHVGLLPGPKVADRYRHRQQVNFSRSVRLRGAGFFLYFNLHKEHHLFPQLPCRYLPRIHQWLREHRSDLLTFTSEHLGILQRRRSLNLFTPTAGDHDD
jgi:fatty acid desaturase